jgi:hypothetical protein
LDQLSKAEKKKQLAWVLAECKKLTPKGRVANDRKSEIARAKAILDAP